MLYDIFDSFKMFFFKFRDPRLLLPIRKFAKTETKDDVNGNKKPTNKSPNTSNGSSGDVDPSTKGWVQSPFFNSSIRDSG